jgi:DNA invertase Pin-like site-specific DNA recombinase
MNFSQIPIQGAASAELAQHMHTLWQQAATRAGIDLSGFSPDAPLDQCLAWARSAGLDIACGYTRFSTKSQDSTTDQARTLVEGAAIRRIYLPPEYLCIDEGRKGRKKSRPGIDRVKVILAAKLAKVFLVFKLSRLARVAHVALAFMSETLVSRGLRGVVVGENIDTADSRAWRLLTTIRAGLDEDAVEVIGDHVREGQITLFLEAGITGALPVGYRPELVPNAPKTRRGLPRCTIAIDEKAAAMIRQHFELIASGMPILSAWRKWRADGGPVDPRCKTGKMSYGAYRKMLARRKYIGAWTFCQKKNAWNSEKDGVEQVLQPPEKVKQGTFEHLRIVTDELFFKVQEILLKKKNGPRLRRDKVHHLWDLIIPLFVCPRCSRSMNMCGARGQYMRCPLPECPSRAMVHREQAVVTICEKLSEMIKADATFIDTIVASFAAISDTDVTELDERIRERQGRIQALTSTLRDLEELLGQGSPEDRRRRKDRLLAIEAERAGEELEIAALKRRRGGGREKPVTRDEVVKAVDRLASLLNDAATGNLGAEVVELAASVFSRLVSGKITVHATRRAGRKRWLIACRFVPGLVGALRDSLQAAAGTEQPDMTEIEVSLRGAPRLDQIADEVRGMYDLELVGFRVINRRLEAKYKQKIGTGNCCLAYRRYFEIRGLPVPPRRVQAGRPRKAG